MRHLLVVACTLYFFFSCKEKAQDDAVFVKGKTLVALPIKAEKVEGLYTGEFKGSPISIVLNYVTNQHASGYNVHKGLTRNLSGRIEFVSGKLHLQLAEPGNNLYDGQFDLQIDTITWKGKASWKPLKTGEETSFTIKKKVGKEADPYNYGETFIDSLSNYIILKPDGSCTYSYLADTSKTGQQITIRGNYQKEKNSVIVFWQKNNLFSSGKSVFTLLANKPSRDEDYVEQSLKGEGRIFYQMMGD